MVVKKSIEKVNMNIKYPDFWYWLYIRFYNLNSMHIFLHDLKNCLEMEQKLWYVRFLGLKHELGGGITKTKKEKESAVKI